MKKKERLKIAFLDSWFLDQSRGSGTTVAIRGLSEALISIGCSVDIISPPKMQVSTARSMPKK